MAGLGASFLENPAGLPLTAALPHQKAAEVRVAIAAAH
jgi:hypothetical protein